MTLDEETELDTLVDAPPPPVRQALMKASHRQPAVRPTSEGSWWTQASRERFSEAGAKATELSQHRREARSIRPMLLGE